MGWLTAIANLFGFLNKLFAFIKERQLRADERNKVKVEQNEEIDKKATIAKDIRSDESLDDSWLLHPSERNK